MPQMAPMSWMLLYFLFLSIYYFMNSMIYFIYMTKTNSSKPNMKLQHSNFWKW